MKSKIFFFTILFPVVLFSQVQSGWYWVNPLPQGHDLRSVDYINQNLIFAAGSAGTIIKSTNEGINWSVVRINTFRKIRAIRFIDNNTGYVIGDSCIFYKTVNSGETWTRISYYSQDNLLDAYFIDLNTGFVSGNSGILKTTNGGINFSLYPIGSFVGYSIQFIDSFTGYCSGSNKTYKTTDCGVSWTLITTFPVNITSNPFFVNTNTGYVANQFSIYKSTNEGGNWISYSTPANYSISYLKFVNDLTGFAMADNKPIIKTTNGGINWFTLPMNNLFGFDFTNENQIFVVGVDGNIYKTSNGGYNWNNLSSGSRSSFESISFPNNNTGYVLAKASLTNSYLVKTTDQGNSWVEFPFNFPMYNYSIYFLNTSTGFVGSIGGQLFKTTNSGINWTLNNTGINSDLFDIEFLNLNTGYIAAFKSIYKTIDGGNLWSPVYYDSNGSYLYKMDFPSTLTGYVVGELLCKTTNGGNNWFSLQRPSQSNSNWSVDFIDDNTGFIGGQYGQISKTTNGGENWSTTISYQDYYLYSIKFINILTGYIVGGRSVSGYNSSIVLKTTNQGLNWIRQNVISDGDLSDIYFFDENNGIIVGNGGVILRTITGGEPIGIEKISAEVPNRFILNQNYPNPFNPVTKIQFDLPKNSFVKLAIFDILGREMLKLVNENLTEGIYEVNWDASNYSSGVYFYKLIAGDYEESKKMVLIK